MKIEHYFDTFRCPKHGPGSRTPYSLVAEAIHQCGQRAALPAATFPIPIGLAIVAGSPSLT